MLKLSDGLFREACLDVWRDYPDVTVNEMLVDAAAMWLVKNPGRFDVIVTSNLFGDILSDLAAGLIGGLGVAPSANIGAGRVAVFEPVHGSAPDIAGQDIANPAGSLLSAAMLLDHLERPEAAGRLRRAVRATLSGGIVTPDLGGQASTGQVVQAIIERLSPRPAGRPVRPATPLSANAALLRGLVEIPSLSGQEGAAARYLVDWMAGRGFDAFVDEAGNALGILDGGPGLNGQTAQDIVLLGHIDTVAGLVPVRIEAGKLYGRGAVDAKGPLAAFAAAAAQVGPRPGWRIVVIGAVEEEAATSKGARYAATQYRPAYALIGEPSGWSRVTLGYKGRLLAEVMVRREMSHSAGPASTASELAVAVWNRVSRRVAEINGGRERAWAQVLPALRSFTSESDGLRETARMELGFRLPLDVGPDALERMLLEVMQIEPEQGALEVAFRGGEQAYRAEKNTALVRAFLAAIRGQGERPGFVLKTGTSDMNVVGPAWQCPIVAYGPGDSRLDHRPDEHVELAGWERGVAVLADVLHRLTGG